MTARSRRGGVWPTPEQELLLRAALLCGPEAGRAWDAWRAAVSLDALDESSARLLPLLYRRLPPGRASAPELQRFQTAYRSTWLKNQLLFRRAARILERLQADGIPTLLLKGAAVTLACYRDYGLRPMSDFDFLVPVEQGPQAMGRLIEAGYEPLDYGWPEALRHKGQYAARNSQNLRDTDGYELDVHWHVFSESWAEDETDHDFWSAAEPITLLGVEVRMPTAADLLLHVCVHGAKWNHTPLLRWAADAMQIMQEAGDRIDWDRLVWQAQKRRFVLQMIDTLTYLKAVLHAPIPEAALAALRQAPASRMIRLHYRAWRSYPGPLASLVRLAFWYVRYARSQNALRFPQSVLGIPAFLQYRWGVRSLRLVIALSVVNTFRRLFRRPKLKAGQIT